jgi:cytochrome P450
MKIADRRRPLAGRAESLRRPPVARNPGDSTPVVGIYRRLKAVITDPVGLIERSATHHGEIFTVETPFSFNVTYVLGEQAYRTVMALPAGHADVGPVFGNLPTVGYWFPREADDDQSLQELILIGRKLAARLVGAIAPSQIVGTVAEVVARRTESWTDHGRVDLAAEFHPIVYETACRVLLGDAVWKAVDPRVVSMYRAIVDGVDVTRAALAKTPFHRLMPEYRATRDLYGVLRQIRSRHSSEESPLLDAVEQARHEFGLTEADMTWMVMYILWNATAYPGSYAIWTLVDVLERPWLASAVRVSEQSRELLGRCFLETLRMSPVSALVRYLAQPLDIEVGQTRYRIPAGDYVAVYSAGIANNPDSVKGHENYDPDRFLSESPQHLALFSRGPFGCVASEFSRLIISSSLAEVLDNYRLALTAPPPPRKCRVGLTYPSGPVWSRVEHYTFEKDRRRGQMDRD